MLEKKKEQISKNIKTTEGENKMREALTNMGVVAAGAVAGGFVSSYGSNAISNYLTKDARTVANADKYLPPADIGKGGTKDLSFYQKAWFYDVLLGVGAGALSIYGFKKQKNLALGGMGASAYLVGRGVVDMVGDFMAEDGNRTYNGRPLQKAEKDAAGVVTVNYPGPLSLRPSSYGSRAMAMPRANTGTVAMF